jgi:hypothetical protein
MFFHGFGLARVESLLCLILALFFFVRVLPSSRNPAPLAEPKPGVCRAVPNSALSILPLGVPLRL